MTSLRTQNDTTFFAELDLPMRFKQDASGNSFTSFGLAVVLGFPDLQQTFIEERCESPGLLADVERYTATN